MPTPPKGLVMARFTKDVKGIAPSARTHIKVVARAAVAGWGYWIGDMYNLTNTPDHCNRGCMDFMTRANSDTSEGTRQKQEFDDMCRFFIKYYEYYHIVMIIWFRRSWAPSRGWRPYSGDGPHMNHIHIQVKACDNSCAPRGCEYNFSWNKFSRPAPPRLAQRTKIPDDIVVFGKDDTDTQGGKSAPSAPPEDTRRQIITAIPTGKMQISAMYGGRFNAIYNIGDPLAMDSPWNADGDDVEDADARFGVDPFRNEVVH
jgi:hypothetical protein